jgi:hypothetical protein
VAGGRAGGTARLDEFQWQLRDAPGNNCALWRRARRGNNSGARAWGKATADRGPGLRRRGSLMEEESQRSEGENAQLYLEAKADEEKYAYLTIEKAPSNLMHQSERLLKSERKAEYSWTPTFVAGSVWWVGMEKARRKTRNNPNFALLEK